MGQNLVLNMNDHGFKVAVFNRTVSKVDDFLANEAKGTQVVGAHSMEEFVGLLKRPRRVMLMVKAGDTVDQMIDQLLPHLEPGDIIIDGGNSLFTDSNRRTKSLAEKGILFIGTGVSGGEEGARHGPSIMPGGNPAAWPHVKPIFQAIAAKVEDGTPCCDWVGEDGAGHYVKMVHNGIEYGDMQLICEAYDLLQHGLGLTRRRAARCLRRLEQGRARQLPDRNHQRRSLPRKTKTARRSSTRFSTPPARRAPASGPSSARSTPASPSRSSAKSVFARCLSALKEERVAASKILRGPKAASQSWRPRASSLKMCAARSTAPRSSATRRATCCCAPRPKRTAGT